MQCFLFCSFTFKATHCYAQIWNKATYKNEILEEFGDCWGLTPADLTDYSHVKNFMLQQMQLKHDYAERFEIHTIQ